MIKPLDRIQIVVIVLAALVVISMAGLLSAASLTEAQRDSYLVWLHSLEETLETRQAAGLDEQPLLYPMGAMASGPSDSLTSGTLHRVALALNELESRPRLLQEPSGRTALSALNRARNYFHVAEYDSAMAWYSLAAQRDTANVFRQELGLETMVTAVASGDSTAVTREVLATLGRRDIQGCREQLILATRFLVARGDTVNLRVLVQGINQDPAAITGALSYWQAFALCRLGRWIESLAILQDLVAQGGLSYGLGESQRAWVLVAIPDLLVLTGQQNEADPLYRAVAQSTIPGAADWSRCQVGVLDFLAGRYLESGTAFERLCDRPGNFVWRPYACRMAELSDEMERLRTEGNDHGAAAVYQR